MSYKTNRRTLKPFPVSRRARNRDILSLLSFKGQDIREAEHWLKDHGFDFQGIVPFEGSVGKLLYSNRYGDLLLLTVTPLTGIVVEEKYQSNESDNFPVGR